MFSGPEDLNEIIRLVHKKTGVDQGDILRDIGQYAFEKLATRHPVFVKGFSSAKEFLKTVEHVIHEEVAKLYDQPDLPTFSYEDPQPNRLIILYHSPRKLYVFMEGLIMGVADFFNERIDQELRIFNKDGREVCEFNLRFS